MIDFDKLQEDVNALNELLKNREEGLSTWNLMVAHRLRLISEAWSGTTQRTPDLPKAAPENDDEVFPPHESHEYYR